MNTKKYREHNAEYLDTIAERIRSGEVKWYAITVQYHNYRMALHTKGAPKRPKGLS